VSPRSDTGPAPRRRAKPATVDVTGQSPWAASGWEKVLVGREAPALSGVADARVHISVGADAGEVRLHLHVANGRIVGGGAGWPGESDAAFWVSEGDGIELLSGRLPLSVAFMQGRLKPSGDQSLVLRLLAFSATPAFEALASRLSSAVDDGRPSPLQVPQGSIADEGDPGPSG
jgi:hypothetical protein